MNQYHPMQALSQDLTPARFDAWERLLLEIVKSMSLPESLYERLEGHYTAIGELLCDTQNPELRDLQIFPQGSVLTRTLVRPLPGSDADVDAVAFKKDGTRLTAREWLDCLLKELEERARTQGTVTRKKRCVTVSYDDSVLPAHVDVTPAVPSAGNARTDGSGYLEVPDYPTNTFHPTNPKDFAEWVMWVSMQRFPLTPSTVRLTEALAKASIQPLPDHEDLIALDPLRLAIKVCKRHRDLFARRHNCEDVQPLSVIITTLVGKAYLSVAQSAANQHGELTILQALRDMVARIPLEFDSSGPGQWLLCNPGRPEENFAEKWNMNPRYAEAFFQWHGELQLALALGFYNFDDRTDFEKQIEESFGVEATRRTKQLLTEAAKSGSVMPGISIELAKKLHNGERAVSTLLGLANTSPTRAQEPRGTGRLG